MRTTRIATIAIPLVLAVLTLGLAVPRFLGAWAMLPGDPVYEAMRPGGTGADFNDLRTLIESRRRAGRWIASDRVWDEMGVAQAALARRAGRTTPEGRRLVAQAISSNRKGLALGPADPYAWLRLADLTTRVEGYSADAAAYLKMSVLTGPNERVIALHRTQLALYLWPRFDAADRALFARQIETHWGRFGCRLAPHVRATGTERVFLDALAFNARALKFFQRCMAAP